jgi:DNA polymerase V
MKKMYALIDCNSFYCSCERIFRPELKHVPVIVLSNNDGCAIARTAEAKALGIKMGDPYFKIKKLCEKQGVAVFSSNFSLYTNISARVMATIAQECPDVEIYSVDEAFADMTGIPNLLEHGQRLRQIILQNIGIPTGVGIAPTKVLAKIANHLAKKSKKASGVVCLDSQRLIDAALKRVAVEDIWGVGRANSVKMKALGIHTAYQFKEFKNERLIQKIFTKVGVQLKHELMGINCFELSDDIDAKKEIMCSRSFGSPVYDKATLKQSIAGYISNAAEKLRAQDSLCTQLTVFARTNPFKNVEQYYMYERAKLINPTNDTRKLLELASEMIDESFRPGLEYSKAGAKLGNFYHTDEYQIDFFHPFDTAEDSKLMKVVDRINYLEGPNTIKFMSCGISDQAWRMNRNHKSPRYTTSWNELPCFNKKAPPKRG